MTKDELPSCGSTTSSDYEMNLVGGETSAESSRFDRRTIGLRPLVSATFKDGTGGSEGKLVVTGSQRLLTHLPKSDVDILLEHVGSAYDLYHETQAGKDLEQELKLKGLFDLADVYEVAGSVQRAVLAQASDDRVHVCFGRCE